MGKQVWGFAGGDEGSNGIGKIGSGVLHFSMEKRVDDCAFGGLVADAEAAERLERGEDLLAVGVDGLPGAGGETVLLGWCSGRWLPDKQTGMEENENNNQAADVFAHADP